MEKKYLRAFMQIFDGVGYAASIIAESKIKDTCEKVLSSVLANIAANKENDVFNNAIREVESNMFLYSNRIESYMSVILRGFDNIVPYFYEKYKENEGYKYGESYNECWKFLDEYCYNGIIGNNKQAKKYIIECDRYLYFFFESLDARCLDFKLDIMELQRDVGMDIYRRERMPRSEYLFSYKKQLDEIWQKKREKTQDRQELPVNIPKELDIDDTARHFNSSYTKEQLEGIFEKLKKGAYLHAESLLNTWLYICGIPDSKEPIEPLKWTKDQDLLANLVNNLFGDSDGQRLWVITENVFTVKGKVPNTGTMKNVISRLKNEWKDKSTKFNELEELLKL